MLRKLTCAIVVGLVGTGLFGCGSEEPVCERYGTCGGVIPDGGSQSSSGGPIGPCDPHGQTPLGEKCGVYLSFTRGNDSNAGVFTYAAKKTFAKAAALALELKQPVFACGEEFQETVKLPPGVTVYGGLDCGDEWRYKPAQKTVIAPIESGVPALDLSPGPEKTVLEDIAVHARDAEKPGESSIAMRAVNANADLVRCELLAGKGGDGTDGESHLPDPMLEGTKGKAGEAACAFVPNPEPVYGGAKVYKACTVDLVSTGGKGGDGGYGAVLLPGVPFPAGGNGENGTPAGLGGKGGVGQPISGMWDCDTGGRGGAGADGADGQPGQGAPAVGPIDENGYVAIDGTPGTPGTLAQGGGGGGGSRGGLICSGNNLSYGAAGGSGGSGGCGGKGGGAGTGGGASIALISVTSSLSFTKSKLAASEAGRGGLGGDGQPGGVGGVGGKGGPQGFYGVPGCAGGHGGKGGNGAPGGGGAGGPAYVIAVSGTPPMISVDSEILQGIAGKGGSGGNANAASNAGADGTAGEIFSF
ncbi:PGRS family protein [Polyangium aurulentum]|uniref:PGRS family protein n=1 Tax=Polyangium aurulentum TaxID=2567896 RepID=UPI0010ADDEE9|nr:PGRS family protein [Polyangium aurulentum]UQA62924.1 PGRS family protein [Polyangium aurulentum]